MDFYLSWKAINQLKRLNAMSDLYNDYFTKLGIIGSIVGDAVGTPVELMTREEIRANGGISDMSEGGAFATEKGEWGDDGSLLLATYDSLNKGYNLNDIMESYRAWYRDGVYSALGRAIDVGPTIIKSIKKYDDGLDACDCGECDNRYSGNGALLRIFPACMYAIKNKYEIKNAIKLILDVTGLSHKSIPCKFASILYYFILREMWDKEILDSGNSYQFCDCAHNAVLKSMCYIMENKDELCSSDEYQQEYSEFIKIFYEKNYLVNIDEIPESGYVYDTLVSVIWCILSSDSYEETVLKAASIHGSSYASMAGGLAAIIFGADSIPKKWIHELKGKDVICHVLGLKSVFLECPFQKL